jgi:hypothetical protein
MASATDNRDLKAEMIDHQKNKGGPEGMKLLEKVDGFFITEEWLVLETFTCGCYQGQNRYKVFDASGKVQLYKVNETTNCCLRECCGKHRPFTMHVMDESGSKEELMMIFHRRYAFCGWAVIPCCQSELYTHYMIDANGNPMSSRSEDNKIATVRVPWLGGCCTPTLDVTDRTGKSMGQIIGPFCCVSTFCGSDFGLHDATGARIGEVKKLQPENLREFVMQLETNAKNFKITFPDTMDPAFKMAVLASVFQLDFEFFEDDRSPTEGRCCDCYLCGWPCSCLPQSLVCCCCYATKKEREEAEKRKNQNKQGAPQTDDMGR